METFDFALDNQMNISRKPNVRVIKFGDGYEQRQRQGIAPILSEYSVSRIAQVEVITAIDNFMKARGGHESFFWTPEGENRGKFVCEEWSVSYSLPYPSFSATFREVRA